VDVDGKLRLSPEDLAVRQAILAPAAAPKASLEWDIDQVRLAAAPVMLRDRQKTIRIQRRGKLAILVTSCKRNRHKQQAIRDTWAKDARLANIDVFFIEGH